MSPDRGWNFPVVSVWMPPTRLHHSCMQSPPENICHIKLSPRATSDLQATMQVNTSLPLWFLLIVSARDLLLLSIYSHCPYNQLHFMSPASPPLYIPFTLKVPKIASRRTLKPHSVETSEQLLKLKQSFPLANSPGNWLKVQCVKVQRWLQENNTLIPSKRRCCLGAGNVSECRERDSGDGSQLLGYVV